MVLCAWPRHKGCTCMHCPQADVLQTHWRCRLASDAAYHDAARQGYVGVRRHPTPEHAWSRHDTIGTKQQADTTKCTWVAVCSTSTSWAECHEGDSHRLFGGEEGRGALSGTWHRRRMLGSSSRIQCCCCIRPRRCWMGLRAEWHGSRPRGDRHER